MFWTQSHSDTCAHIPFPTCFVALRPTLERTCTKIQGKKKHKLLHYFLGALEVTVLAWMLRLKFKHSPYKLGGSHCRFEKLWGKNSLNATLNGRSHYNKSPEPLIWGLFDHSPSESYPSLSLSFADICVSPTLFHSLTQSQTAHSRSTLHNLWCCCYTCDHCCTVRRAEV